ncbi:4'-phosphopantetheinyl transferase superfamily protein [Cellulophaga sp. HaHaR_3_176]|uniref:4'-phosphopantetheinyl transferase family protein n=1 Tax=Cellulophaga sp. HaHaR_3_176 TaxID=1942464 RepID=UPI001C1F3084|nr:4'-phosphopantetheinyl transferase superfamily protein [Cellulophaga sp. HaHaR_3_176]QWX82698.1 4'-phosphopantetheinyl transferase superfamily protein [Cellulophaga sp. HaHaR_3_176]
MNNSPIKIFCKTFDINSNEFVTPNSLLLGIKIYKIKISDYIQFLPKLKLFLNVSENTRASKYYHEHDSHRFIICRGLLKFILGDETGMSASEIELKIDSNKKPYLSTNPSIHFNVSHSKNYALIAVASQPVGVDIEYLAKDFNFSEIISTVFSVTEINEVQKKDNNKRLLFKLWTRKEAIVKATGKGINDNIINIPVLDGDHLLNSDFLNFNKDLQVISFNVEEDYIGTIAYSGLPEHTKNLHFHPIPFNI